MIYCLVEKDDDIRWDIMGGFAPYVIYSGENEDSLAPFEAYYDKESAIETAELMSTFPPPVKCFIKVFYMPDKKDIAKNVELLWSKLVEPRTFKGFIF